MGTNPVRRYRRSRFALRQVQGRLPVTLARAGCARRLCDVTAQPLGAILTSRKSAAVSMGIDRLGRREDWRASALRRRRVARCHRGRRRKSPTPPRAVTAAGRWPTYRRHRAWSHRLRERRSLAPGPLARAERRYRTRTVRAENGSRRRYREMRSCPSLDAAAAPCRGEW